MAKTKEGIREKIVKKRDDVSARIDKNGRCDGTEIATYEEMHWLAGQMALRGVLFTFSANNSVYRQGDESYYYFNAISAAEERDKVMEFLSHNPVLSVRALQRLIPDGNDEDSRRVADNVKQVRRLVMVYQRRRQRIEQARKQEEEEWERERREKAEREAAMQEAYAHRDDVQWLVSRIEAQGWQVTLSRPTGTNRPSLKERIKNLFG